MLTGILTVGKVGRGCRQESVGKLVSLFRNFCLCSYRKSSKVVVTDISYFTEHALQWRVHSVISPIFQIHGALSQKAADFTALKTQRKEMRELIKNQENERKLSRRTRVQVVTESSALGFCTEEWSFKVTWLQYLSPELGTAMRSSVQLSPTNFAGLCYFYTHKVGILITPIQHTCEYQTRVTHAVVTTSDTVSHTCRRITWTFIKETSNKYHNLPEYCLFHITASCNQLLSESV